MIKEIIQTGLTAEEAINSGCLLLGYPREECEYEIIDLPKSSFFGLKKTPAKVRVWKEVPDLVKAEPKKAEAKKPEIRKPERIVKDDLAKGKDIVKEGNLKNGGAKAAPKNNNRVDERTKKAEQPKERSTFAPKPVSTPKATPKPVTAAKPVVSGKEKPVLSINTNFGDSPAKEPVKVKKLPIEPEIVRGDNPEDATKASVATEYVAELVSGVGIENFKVEHSWKNGGLYVAIIGSGLGTIIGRRGETLDAIQYLAGLTINRLEGEYLRVTVDAGDYRVKRNLSLVEMANKAVEQVLRTNVSKVLEPMNAAERRIVHATIAEFEEVQSSSIGVDPYRKVVVKTPTSKMRSDRDRGSRGKGSGNYGNRDSNRRKPDSRPSPRVSRENDKEVKTATEEIKPISKERADETPLYGKIEF